MKAGLTTSTVLHAALLGFGLVTLSAPRAFEPVQESLPVNIIPIEEYAQATQGDKEATMQEKSAPVPTTRPDVVADAQKIGDNSVDTDAPVTPDPKPRPVEEAAAPAPQPKPVEKPRDEEVPKPAEEPKPVPATEVAPVPEPKQEVQPDPAKEPEPQPVKEPEPTPAPEPKPEPVKQPEPEPKPEPVKQPEPKTQPDPKPEPVKQPDPKPTPSPEPQQTAAISPSIVKPDAVAEAIDQAPAESQATPEESVALPSSAPAPAARPKPAEASTAKAPDRKASDQPVKEASSKPKSDSTEASVEDKVTELLNKQKSSGGGAKRSTETAALGGKKKTGEKLTNSEMGALSDQLAGCWSIPAGTEGGSALRVSVKFNVSPTSGKVEGRPQIESSSGNRPFDESAIRAVMKCDRDGLLLPPGKEDTWAEVVVNFDPTEMGM